jgi:hypothetical protein
MISPDTLARLLSLRVDLRDEKACAEITPEMANAYLKAMGWKNTRPALAFFVWERGPLCANVPRAQSFADYGRRMVELVNGLATAEGRSPLVVWIDMMGLALGEKAA